MNREEISRVFDSFEQLRVLIIGDVMIDAYYYGKVERISPEAPVPIVSVVNKDQRLGGAANVALNIKALGATPILCSAIGDDDQGKTFTRLLEQEGLSAAGILPEASRPTTVKTRIISDSQQMLRVDEEITKELDAEGTQRLADRIELLMDEENIDVVIFEDYDKGVITPKLIELVVAASQKRSLPVAVDPKRRNFGHYRNVTLFKPNLKELREGLKIDLDSPSLESLTSANKSLKDELNQSISLITLSERGVFVESDSKAGIYPAHLRSIADVSGAGDTVISVAALGLALNLDPGFWAQLANLAGGLVCEEVGVVPINRDKLREEALLLLVEPA